MVTNHLIVLIYTLKNNGVINTLKKGVYSTTSKKNFAPAIDKKLNSKNGIQRIDIMNRNINALEYPH